MGPMPAPQRSASGIATGRDAQHGVLGLPVNLPPRVSAARRGGAGPLLAQQQRQGYSPWRTEQVEEEQEGYFSTSSVLDEGSTTTSSDEPWYLPNARGATRRTPRPAVSLPALPRHQPATPRPVPIIHSSAYQQALVQTRTMSPGVAMNSDDEDAPRPAAWQRGAQDGAGTAPSGEGATAAAAAAAPPATPTGTVLVRAGKRSVTRPGAAGSPEPFQGSALEWALHKADASLDELEDNPLPLQKAVYEISRGPVGTATSSAVQAAAKLTVRGAVEVAKMAAPIGKWALQEGAKAAAGLITRALIESVKTPQGSRGKDNGSGGKDGGSGGKAQQGGLTGTMLLKRRSPAPPPPQPSRQQQQQQRKGR